MKTPIAFIEGIIKFDSNCLMSGTTTFLLYRATIDPYPEGYETLKEILDDPKVDYTSMSSNGNSFELDGLVRKTHGIYYGTFCLLQTQELPPKVKFGNEPEELLSDDDEDTGLGYYTSFFYDPTYHMIGIQSNRNGISANGIATFFRRNYKVKDISFEFVINPAELARLNNLADISSFEVSIAKMGDASAFSSQQDNQSFKQIAKIADDTKANVFRLYFGVGYQRSATLRKGTVIDYVRSILGKKAVSNITKIEIRGREGDDEALQIVDLINNKIKLVVTLPRVRSINRNYNQRIISKAIDEYNGIVPDLKTYKVKAKN